MTANYRGKTTSDVKVQEQGLPVGEYKAMIVGEKDDPKGRGVIYEYEVVDGEHKGRKGSVWYLIFHENQTTSDIAWANLKRIEDATGKALGDGLPAKNRVMRLVVRQQKKNPEYTEIAKYLPESGEGASEPPLA